MSTGSPALGVPLRKPGWTPRGSESPAVGLSPARGVGALCSVGEPAHLPPEARGPHRATATTHVVTTTGLGCLHRFPARGPDVHAPEGLWPVRVGEARGARTHLDQARGRVPPLLKVLLPMLLLNFQSKARPQDALGTIRVRPCA